jgi:hypothetical protein
MPFKLPEKIDVKLRNLNNSLKAIEVVDVEEMLGFIKEYKAVFIRDMKEAAVITILSTIVVSFLATIFYIVCSRIFM